MSNEVWCVIPAAGVGKRMLSAIPKQYLRLHGKTVLEHSLSCFLQHPKIKGVVVVLGAHDDYWLDIASKYQGLPVYRAVGGQERADSVLSGLKYLQQHLNIASTAKVLVHDAARPCLSQQDLSSLLASNSDQGALLATPVRDTMKRAFKGQRLISHTEERADLWHALTPQLASLGLLIQALEQALKSGATLTDEASALEYLGLQPLLVEGDASNIKITRPADLALAEFFLQEHV
ncbi:2-C-methyl-D-erythritol 4-phosphate cytidylyltransferase [uncultured Thiothrix sp.]|uniref:2-C-methyl-D-erythritol 4-phosphate cytidylyltransferase n=1 Tax=uncultured Thiothrix sp. TaxID=223185 RepID=UPI00262E3C8A|nr:2-C-methyl-D-erythritol 4-phosphate cytidylyltransferase [uncultured Thiothrix sp.]